MSKITRSGDGRYTIKVTRCTRLLHIETPLGIINLYPNLLDENNNPIINISILPDTSDDNGSPINVKCLTPNDEIIEGNTSIRMKLMKNPKQLTLIN